ncbi:phage tail sheath C-terminal domain-containing protein [Methylophilus luteus]|uniref:Phage tail sheath C-terminal domain-containing protein n=1 Tax=Methylophilus luteus TaxID=640108 RepID=A0ABW3F987_9PROT
MAQYKTPGVYIQEVASFPPEITAVATAVPAFIGYTEKAWRDGAPLTMKPVYINHLAEYERYFGTAPAPEVAISLDSDNQIIEAEACQPFYLYHSLRLFFSNGGSACVIVSVGDYSSQVSQAALAQGLASIEHETAPTLIVIPEAVQLEDHGVALYTAALAQCAQLLNRMTICDLRCQLERTAFAQEVDYFRSNIGNQHLKYAAAYGPWLRTTFTSVARLGDLTLKRQPAADSSENSGVTLDAAALLTELTADAQIKSKVADLSLTEQVCKLLSSGEARLLQHAVSLQQAVDYLGPDLAASSITDYHAPLRAQSLWLLSLLDVLAGVVTDCPDTALIKFSGTISSQAHTRMAASLRLLVAHHHTLLAHTGIALLDEAAACNLLALKDQAAMLALTPLPDVAADYLTASTDLARAQVAQRALTGILRQAAAWFSEVQLSAETTARALNHDLTLHYDVFRRWSDSATQVLNTLPASGAVAGVYAQVDRDRGVWKAPANVALQQVVSPACMVTDEDQQDYNQPADGKAINIIRAFGGKGNRVWGARTLAGNDNEWRYVNVRRLFGMVQASIDLSLQGLVFEANDANTWAKVTALLENFLLTLWRQGALFGSQPKEAFFVNLGLGKTMNAEDIAAGRLLLEIGLAPLRPAEFIMFRLALNMQQS